VIGWNRLLEGRWRDPLVGRDVLVGVLGGVVMLACYQLQALAPAWLGLPYSPFYIEGRALTTSGVGLLFLFVQMAVVWSLLSFFLMFFLMLVLRHGWLAVAAWCLVEVAFFAPYESDAPAVEVPLMALSIAAEVVVMLRFGLLALAVASFTSTALTWVPLAADPSAWYAGIAWTWLAGLAGLAVYAAVVALGEGPLARLGLAPGD
jgi:serine/threonine-protein kinase